MMFSSGFERKVSQQPLLLFLWASIGAVYVAGLFVPVMNVDAAQYALISAEMYRTGQYLEVKFSGNDYLDKPPLLFWLSALSFHLFGIGTVSYKIFSVLVVWLGIYAVWRLTQRLYDRNTAQMAALMLATCQAFFVFSNDVRTDALLTGMVALAIWQLYEYGEQKKIAYLIGGSIAVGLAMLAKGPLGLVVPAAALVPHWLFRRQWSMLWRPQWLLAMCIVAALLAPMLVGLYRQHGWYGIKFYFWTQSFGRITGENPWRNEAGFFYFWKELLWAYLPWSLWVLGALFWQFRHLFFRSPHPHPPEYLSWFGFLLPFIALSFSKFKLSHYIFVVFPMAAIFTAAAVQQWFLQRRLWNIMASLQLVVLVVLTGAAVAVNVWLFPLVRWELWLLFGLLVLGAMIWLLRGTRTPQRLISGAALVAVAINLLMNVHVYHRLIDYQAGTTLAALLKQRQWNAMPLGYLDYYDMALEFYLGRNLPWYDQRQLDSLLAHNASFLVIGREAAAAWIERSEKQPISVDTIPNFGITRLTPKFLHPQTRHQAVERVYLIRY